MSLAKADIIAKLQKDILSLQGYKLPLNGGGENINLGQINYAFPNNRFPLGAVHEFCCDQKESAAATSGFIAGILSSLMRSGSVAVWIGSSQTIFPPALKWFGIDPEKILFIILKKEKDILWTMEEALKCEGLAAVVGEIKNLDFISSRRLQLAVEQSRSTGFIIRNNSHPNTTACITRWKITSLPSSIDLPGVGFPNLNVELLKVRNGKPGTWQIEWKDKQFHETPIHETRNEIPAREISIHEIHITTAS
jgi:protein ImuA